MGRPKLIDDENLISMWRAGASAEVIGRVFGVTHRRIYERANELGLPRRRFVDHGGACDAVRGGATQAAMPGDVERRLARLGGAKARARPECWSERHDARLIETQGKYGEIARLSNEWWIEEGVLKTRWLAIR